MIILTYGDNPKTSTGYGNVWDNLLKRIIEKKPDWKVYHLGWQGKDRPHETKDGYTMLPCGREAYGFDTVFANIMRYKPDFFITMADVGIQGGYIGGVTEAKKAGWTGKWIAWNPFDCDDWENMYWTNILQYPDMNLAMANNGECMMRNKNLRNVKNVPLGVDTKVFFPLNEKVLLKKKFNLHDKFVIGFVGRNQRRKMIANLIKGYAQFSKGKDDVKLLLHTDKASNTGWEVPCLVVKYNEYDPELEPNKKVIFTKDNLDPHMRQFIQQENMNEIYNLMDVFCYATGGEGFGIPGLECQSSGVPLMMTECSTSYELCRDHGILIPVLKDSYGRKVEEIGFNGVTNKIPDDKEIAKLLEGLYLDWKTGGNKLKELSEKARSFALTYDYDIITNKFIQLLEHEK